MMEREKEILVYIESAISILNDMIVKASEQKAKNFNMLYTVRVGLTELTHQLLQNDRINRSFIIKWDNIMGWAPRVFEDHPLLELLRKIDDFVVKRYT